MSKPSYNASMAAAKLAPPVPVFKPKIIESEKTVFPKIPADANPLDYAPPPYVYGQTSVQQTDRSRKWCCAIALLILLLLVVLGIVFGLIFGLRSPSMSSTQITSIQALPLQPVGQLMAPPTAAASTQQQPQSCLKHCNDKTYIACPCGQDCDCSAAKLPSSSSSMTISQSSSSSMSSWISDFWHPLSSFYSSSDEAYLDTTCIALCYPDYTPHHVDCDDIDEACN